MPARAIVFFTVQLLVCLYALWRGGMPERLTAWMMALAAILTSILAYELRISFSQVSVVIVLIDVALLIGLVLLALRADRFWPIWVAALQLLSIGIHVTRGLDPTILPMVYNRTLGKVAYPMMVLLVIGTFRHQRRARGRVDPDWSPLRW
jgi:hypothetical protein